MRDLKFFGVKVWFFSSLFKEPLIWQPRTDWGRPAVCPPVIGMVLTESLALLRAQFENKFILEVIAGILVFEGSKLNSSYNVTLLKHRVIKKRK